MKTLCFILLSLVLALPSTADVLWLKNGRSLEGKVRELPDGKVEIILSFGSFAFSKAQVDRVESSITLEEIVDEALRNLGPDDSESLFELAQWCRDKNAHTLARQLFEEVLAIDPDHEGAHQELDHRQVAGRWVDEERFHELRGETYYRDGWVTHEERARIVALEASAEERAHERGIQQAHLEIEAARLRLEAERVQRPEASVYGTTYVAPVAGYFGPLYPSRRHHRAPPKASAPPSTRTGTPPPPRRRASGPRQHRGGYVRQH